MSPETLARQTGNHLLSAPLTPDRLRAIAAAAIDAATKAGASYADVRVAERQQIGIEVFDITASIDVESRFTYGIRVIVDGTWASAFGASPTIDAVVAAAQAAVATARSYRQVTPQRAELVPAPAVTGEWSTPIQTDPFGVSVEEQTALLYAYRSAVQRVHDGKMFWNPVLQWHRETRVFASNEGSLVTQTFYRSDPKVDAAGSVGMGGVRLFPTLLSPGAGGYETVTRPGTQEQLKQLAEEAVAFASLPRRALDVGRYPIVLDGLAMGTVLGLTVGRALELDRALGQEAETSGTSFLAPVEAVLGAQRFSAALSVTADRALPHVDAAKWDDEGVVPQAYPVIMQGRVVDYHTSRQTASALRAWTETRGVPLRSSGCASTARADGPVMVRMPHLTTSPDPGTVTLDDLAKGISHGVLIRGKPWVIVDPQLSYGTLFGGQIFEIARGKVVRRIEGNIMQFATERFFRSLTAVGGAATTRTGTFVTGKGYPSLAYVQSMTAPAGLFKDIEVTSTKIRI
jgi:TldD protein